MICPTCQENEHEGCRGGSWCDCQHREIDPNMVKREPSAM